MASLPAVLTELWISVASLTRSHLAALEITGRLKNVAFEQHGWQLQLRGAAGTLTLEMDPESGRGTWTLNRTRHGTSRGQWKLKSDAMVEFTAPPASLDMELAVEQFCAMLMV